MKLIEAHPSRFCGTALAVWALVVPNYAQAQPVTAEETPAENATEATAPEGDGPSTEGETTGDTAEQGPSEETPPSATAPLPAPPEDSEQAQEIAELKEAVVALQAAQEEAEMAALLGGDEALDVEQDLFRLYGFMDMGFQRSWVNDESIVAATFDTNASTFVVGNIDLYFDFNPHPDWRALAEIRFTNAPHGDIEEFGGITGKNFKRTNTSQFDPHATQLNARLWGGYTVIERAWIEWKRFQQFRLRTGSFFTPFGIWNVDHGSPTLISSAMPQFIQQNFFPVRQTGMQALGSFFAGDWEVAYRAWLTNGRTEISTLDFTDDKAFGGRFFAKKDGGTVRSQFGASYHHGRVSDKIVDITGAPPVTESITFNNYESEAYVENIMGVDISVDVGDLRIRSEATAQLRRFEEGKRRNVGISSPIPGAQYADYWRKSVYGLVAYQLPWWGLEPYFYGEVMQQDWELPDGLAMIAPGLNIRFNPSAQLKTQFTRAIFFNWKHEKPGDESFNNVTSVLARLVLAF